MTKDETRMVQRLREWGQADKNIARLLEEAVIYNQAADDAYEMIPTMKLTQSPKGKKAKRDAQSALDALEDIVEQYRRMSAQCVSLANSLMAGRNELDALIGTLNPNQRQVLSLRFRERMSFDAIAEKIFVNERTARRWERKAIYELEKKTAIPESCPQMSGSDVLEYTC
jgi:RNA polymerase sigma factor (sigma-70 family)